MSDNPFLALFQVILAIFFISSMIVVPNYLTIFLAIIGIVMIVF